MFKRILLAYDESEPAQKAFVPALDIRIGHPAEQIIAAAEEWNADLIVTGHRGKGLFERWLLGSVSRLVIAYARCAVIVIR